MDIRQLNSHNLNSSLQAPPKDTLHVWNFAENDMDNLHKSLHEYAHFLLREILSMYTGISAGKLHFGTEKHGKPYLADPENPHDTGIGTTSIPYCGIWFNLSHSGEQLVLAFSTSGPVGIDIEKTARSVDMDKVASRIFLPCEAAYLKTLDGEEKRQQFFALWTRTESFLKGIGTGLSASFTDKEIQEEYTSWKTSVIPAPSGYICTVAYRNL